MRTTAPPTMSNENSLNLVSTGKLACTLQRSTREIAHAARSAGLSPAVSLNDVPYYSVDDAEAIARWFRTHTTDQQGAFPCDRAGG